jgi:hypothetical protein
MYRVRVYEKERVVGGPVRCHKEKRIRRGVKEEKNRVSGWAVIQKRAEGVRRNIKEKKDTKGKKRIVVGPVRLEEEV